MGSSRGIFGNRSFLADRALRLVNMGSFELEKARLGVGGSDALAASSHVDPSAVMVHNDAALSTRIVCRNNA